MKYKLLYGNDIEEFESLVSSYLSSGWQCNGPVVIYITEYQDRSGPITQINYVQAVVGEIK